MRMLAALFLLLCASVLPAPVGAQENDALRFFQQNPSSPRLLFRQAPRPQTQPAPRPRRLDEEPVARRRVPRATESEIAGQAQPDAPVQPPSVFVHVIGDSLSENLANGLRDHMAAERPDTAIVRRSNSSSGLVRQDYHNWPQTLRDMLANTENKVDLVAVMLGSNERQTLRDETGSHEFRSDRWREIYSRRVDELIAVAQEKRAALVWVGMPVFESQRLSADMLFLNEIYKERAQRAGIPYVDVWDGFVSDQNQFTATGPDVNGEIVRLRTNDGIHFTRAGSRKLGFFAAPEILRNLGRDRQAAPALAALPQDLSEQIRRDTPGLAPLGLQGALPLPDELPNLPIIRERPLQGPVIELTAAPVTPGAQLLRRRLVAPATEMTLMVEQVLAYGRSVIAKPGRADDFRWPGDRPLN
jgi:uncharacterized protein